LSESSPVNKLLSSVLKAFEPASSKDGFRHADFVVLEFLDFVIIHDTIDSSGLHDLCALLYCLECIVYLSSIKEHIERYVDCLHPLLEVVAHYLLEVLRIVLLQSVWL